MCFKIMSSLMFADFREIIEPARICSSCPRGVAPGSCRAARSSAPDNTAPHPLGRDDFNFLSWIVSASSYIVSVTERNSLDSMVLVRVVPHTQHKRYPCDRNFSKE